MLFVVINSQDNNSGLAFGFVLGVFPMFIGFLLVVPSTIFRTIFICKYKLQQTRKEKVVFGLGVLISALFFVGIIKIVAA